MDTWNAAQGEFRLPPAIPDRPGTRGGISFIGYSSVRRCARSYAAVMLVTLPKPRETAYVTARLQPLPPQPHSTPTTGPRQDPDRRERGSHGLRSQVRVEQCTIGMVGWRATGLLRKPSATEATRAPINGPEWGDPWSGGAAGTARAGRASCRIQRPGNKTMQPRQDCGFRGLRWHPP